MYNLREEERIMNEEHITQNNSNNDDKKSSKLIKCFSHMINNWEFMSLQFLLFTMFTYNFFLYYLRDNLQLFYLYNIIDAIINLVIINLFLLFITNNFTIHIYKDDFKKSAIFLIILFVYFIVSDTGIIIYCKNNNDVNFNSTDIILVSTSIIGKLLIEIILIYNLRKNTGEPIDFSEYYNSNIEEINKNIMNEAVRIGKEERQINSNNTQNNYNSEDELNNKQYGRGSTDAIQIDIDNLNEQNRKNSIHDEVDNLFHQLNGSKYLPPILINNDLNKSILVADEDSDNNDNVNEEYTVSDEVDEFFLNNDSLLSEL